VQTDWQAVVPVDLMTVPRFAAVTGYTEDAVRAKIARGDWLVGKVWLRAPDGRILVSLRGYHAWAEGQEYELPVAGPSRSISSGRGADTVSDFDSHRRRRTSSTPPASKPQ
jgi:hypothetical protein